MDGPHRCYGSDERNHGVRAMGQEDPVRAYTNEGFEMYEEMTRSIQEDTVKYMMNVEIRQNIERKQVLVPEENLTKDMT